jgi:hypothetical protein
MPDRREQNTRIGTPAQRKTYTAAYLKILLRFVTRKRVACRALNRVHQPLSVLAGSQAQRSANLSQPYVPVKLSIAIQSLLSAL